MRFVGLFRLNVHKYNKLESSIFKESQTLGAVLKYSFTMSSEVRAALVREDAAAPTLMSMIDGVIRKP
jgi:hypothetical protein